MCRENKRVKKRRFASSVLHSCNVKTQICVTRPQCVKMSSTWPAAVRFSCSSYELHMTRRSKMFLFSKVSRMALQSTQSAKWMGIEVSFLVWCKMSWEWIQLFHLLLRLWTHESILLLHTPSHSVPINYGQQHSFTSLNISVHIASSRSNITANATLFLYILN